MSEAFLLRIDDPEDYALRQAFCRICGWCAGPDRFHRRFRSEPVLLCDPIRRSFDHGRTAAHWGNEPAVLAGALVSPARCLAAASGV